MGRDTGRRDYTIWCDVSGIWEAWGRGQCRDAGSGGCCWVFPVGEDKERLRLANLQLR